MVVAIEPLESPARTGNQTLVLGKHHFVAEFARIWVWPIQQVCPNSGEFGYLKAPWRNTKTCASGFNCLRGNVLPGKIATSKNPLLVFADADAKAKSFSNAKTQRRRDAREHRRVEHCPNKLCDFVTLPYHLTFLAYRASSHLVRV